MKSINFCSYSIALLVIFICYSAELVKAQSPEVVSGWGMGPATTVQILDNSTIVFNTGGTFIEADFSEPGNPQIISKIRTKFNSFNWVTKLGSNYLGSTQSPRQMYFHDEENEDFEDFKGVLRSVYFQANHEVLVGDTPRGIRVISLSELTDIDGTVFGTFVNLEANLRAFDLVDNTLYALTNQSNISTLHVVDVSDPDNPEITDQIVLDIDAGYAANVVGDMLVTIDDRDIIVLDISDTENIEELARYVPESGKFMHIQLTEDFMYASNHRLALGGPSHVSVFSGSDLTSLEYITQVNKGVTIGSENMPIKGFSAQGTDLYIAAGPEGVYHYELQPNSDFELQSHFRTHDEIRHHEQYEDTFFALTSDSTLYTVDITDPLNPQQLGKLDVNGTTDIHVVDDQTLIITLRTGFEIVDISSLENPELLSTYSFSEADNASVKVTSRDNLVFVAVSGSDANQRVEIVDITDRATPQNIYTDIWSNIFSSSNLYPVVYGDHLFLIERGEMNIYDISDINEPVMLDDTNISRVRNHQLYQNYIIGYNGRRLNIVDISDVSNIQTSSFLADEDIFGYALIEDKVVLGYFSGTDNDNPSTANSRLITLDLADMDNIVEIDNVTVLNYNNSNPNVIGGTENAIFVEGSGGFLVYNHQLPTDTFIDDYIGEHPAGMYLHQNYPNPFNPSTNISFELAAPETIELAIYDITGRQVARLSNGMFSSGTHTIQFDAGNLASGIYMIRLSSEQTTLVRSMTLIK